MFLRRIPTHHGHELREVIVGNHHQDQLHTRLHPMWFGNGVWMPDLFNQPQLAITPPRIYSPLIIHLLPFFFRESDGQGLCQEAPLNAKGSLRSIKGFRFGRMGSMRRGKESAGRRGRGGRGSSAGEHVGDGCEGNVGDDGGRDLRLVGLACRGEAVASVVVDHIISGSSNSSICCCCCSTRSSIARHRRRRSTSSSNGTR
mmetsp:Transcript_1828/g.2663  ORF Transcript_1828/g.2663 Transcript_1828/m.2663 type:complete len:201 (-) Transcript_1828:80-682(-)